MKRILLACVLLALCLAPQADAQFYIRGGGPHQTWTCSLVSLAATLTQCQPVPSASSTPPADATQHWYITDIVVGTTTATSGTYSIQTGTGTNCATNTLPLFPARNTADRFNAPVVSNPSADFHLISPLQAPAGAAICVIGVATNTINIQLVGYYG